jgi:D-arginine dehydrogenase
MEPVDVAILGGGIAGLSAAWWLGELGGARPPRVVLLEREPELARQSSARSAALLRTASDDAVLEAFALESARLVRELEAGLGAPLVERRGLVLLGRGARAPAEGWERRVARQPHARPFAPEELARRAPHVVHAGEEAWLFPDEGCLDVARLVGALARGAAERGVELRTRSGAHALERTAEGFVAHVAGGARVAARQVVVAAGGWSADLGRLAGARVALRPTRRHLFVTLPVPGIDPAAPVVWNERTGFYSRPEAGGLLACACDTLDADPAEHGVEPRVEAAWRAKCADNLRGLPTLALARAWSGTRTFARDERFVVGPDPDAPGLHWCAGLGGHGMTAGFAAGRLAAEQVLGRATDARFAAAFAPERLLSRARPPGSAAGSGATGG